MATKKPKGIIDNPLGTIKNLYNAVTPGGRDVTQPQSLAQFKDVTRAAAAGTVKAADLYTTGGLGVSFAQNVIMPAATIASKETRTTKASKGMTQFAKDAAITAASAGAGYVAGKAASGINNATKSAIKKWNSESGDLESLRGLYHGTAEKLKPGTIILPRSETGIKKNWSGVESNPNVAYSTPSADFAETAGIGSRFTKIQEKGFYINPGFETKKLNVPTYERAQKNPLAYNKAVRDTRPRVYEVEPVDRSSIVVNKIDKVREYTSPKGFVVKKEVFRSKAYTDVFPRSPIKTTNVIRSLFKK